MKPTTAWLEQSNLLLELQELHERSRQLCKQTRAVCAKARQVKSPWPHPLTPAALLPEEPALQQEDVLLEEPQSNPHDLAMEALRLIRTIIDEFPLEWQVAILKALTARTILKGHERTQPAPVVMSA
jgi:hypothetical protein